LALLADFFSRAARFSFLRVEDGGRSAVQAFTDVLAELLHFQGAELVFLFQEAERFADNLAGGSYKNLRRFFRGSSPQGEG